MKSELNTCPLSVYSVACRVRCLRTPVMLMVKLRQLGCLWLCYYRILGLPSHARHATELTMVGPTPVGHPLCGLHWYYYDGLRNAPHAPSMRIAWQSPETSVDTRNPEDGVQDDPARSQVLHGARSSGRLAEASRGRLSKITPAAWRGRRQSPTCEGCAARPRGPRSWWSAPCPDAR